MADAISRILEDVTGRLDGLPGIQIKSVDHNGTLSRFVDHNIPSQ